MDISAAVQIRIVKARAIYRKPAVDGSPTEMVTAPNPRETYERAFWRRRSLLISSRRNSAGECRFVARVGPIAKVFEGHALKLLEDPKSIDRLGEMAKLYGAVKVGNMAMPSLRSLGSIAEAAGGSLGIGGAELAAAAGPAALALGAMTVSVFGAVHALTDADSAFHDVAMRQLAGIEKNLEGPGKLYDSLKKLETAVMPVADFMGTVLLTELNFFTNNINHATSALAKLSEVPGKVIDRVQAQFGIMNDDKPVKTDYAREFSENVYNPIKAIATAIAEREKTNPTKTGAGGGGGGMNTRRSRSTSLRIKTPPGSLASSATISRT